MLSRRSHPTSQLAFTLLCLFNLGLVSAAPIPFLAPRPEIKPQSDNEFILQAYKEKLEGLVGNADELKTKPPPPPRYGPDDNRLQVENSELLQVSDHDKIYMDQIAQLKAENKALHESIDSLQTVEERARNKIEQNNNYVENEEEIADDDLDYPVLPDPPQREATEIQRKRGRGWHTVVKAVDAEESDISNENGQSEAVDNPGFEQTRVSNSNSVLLSQLSPEAVQSEEVLKDESGAEGNQAENKLENDSPANDSPAMFEFQEVAATSAADSDSDIEKAHEMMEKNKKERTATTDVVTLTVAAIALFCSVVFIVFTAVQWRGTLKNIKLEQVKSSRNMRNMSRELKKIQMSQTNLNSNSEMMMLEHLFKRVEEEEQKEEQSRSDRSSPIPRNDSSSSIEPENNSASNMLKRSTSRMQVGISDLSIQPGDVIPSRIPPKKPPRPKKLPKSVKRHLATPGGLNPLLEDTDDMYEDIESN